MTLEESIEFDYLLGWCRGDLEILYKTMRELEIKE